MNGRLGAADAISGAAHVPAATAAVATLLRRKFRRVRSFMADTSRKVCVQDECLRYCMLCQNWAVVERTALPGTGCRGVGHVPTMWKVGPLVRPRDRGQMNDEELVTVVVPARNEERFLGACLDSVQAQDYPALQIVVVDGASTDATVGIVRARMAEDERVELLHNARPNIPSSLNLAVDTARGRWLVRVDAHSTVGPTHVRTAVQRLREGTWAAVGGRQDWACQ